MKIVGYTTEMDRWMAAADFLVGKAGGLTSSEALARRLLLIIVNPIPGQEERNSDHFLEEGAAIRCNNLPALAFKIDALLDDPERIARMRGAVQRLAKPDAAAAIVSIVTRDERERGEARIE
jgi:processive 1,2-diacylglycerol beta-glucosyltransferase